MIFSLLFIVNFFINLLLRFLLIFDKDLLSSGTEGEDLLLFEETAETGLWYRLSDQLVWDYKKADPNN